MALQKISNSPFNVIRPQDFFTGDIKVKGRVVSKVFGTYLGFMEFDGKRYWDIRDAEKFPMIKPANHLPSDSRNRPDLLKLLDGNVEEAQTKKEELEEAQRYDAKLREANKKKTQS